MRQSNEYAVALMSAPDTPKAQATAKATVGLVAARKGKVTWLEVQPAACTRCASGRGCGAALLSRQSPRLLRTPTQKHWSIGMTVPLPRLNQSLLVLAGGAYGVPLVGLLVGMVLGTKLGLSLGIGELAIDAVGLAAGLVGLWSGASAYRWLADRRLDQRGDCPL